MNTSFIFAVKSITNLRLKDVIIIFTTIASLSLMEIVSLGLIGVYISFLVDQSLVMEFLEDNVTFFYNFLITLNSNEQFIYIGTMLALVFLAKFFLNLGANYIIFKFGIDQQIRIQNDLITTFLLIPITIYYAINKQIVYLPALFLSFGQGIGSWVASKYAFENSKKQNIWIPVHIHSYPTILMHGTDTTMNARKFMPLQKR